MFSGSVCHEVEPAAHGRVEDALDERTLARARNARHYGEDIERNPDVDAAQVVHPRSLDVDAHVPGAVTLGNLYLLFVAQVFDGVALGIFLQELPLLFLVCRGELRGGTGVHHLSAQSSGIGSDVYQVVGGTHDFLVVLHHHHGVAQLLQFPQHLDEPVGVTAVQSDAWLIEDVYASHEGGTEAGGEVDALALSAGEGVGETVEREVAQSHIQKELQSVGNFRQQPLADASLLFGQLQMGEPFGEVGDGHLHQFGDALAAYLHIARFLLQSCAAAVGAHGLATEAAQHHAVLYLVLVLLHHAEELVDAHPVVRFAVFLRGQTVPEPVLLLLCQFEVGLEDREVVRLRAADELLEPHTHLLSPPAHHATVVETHGLVGDDEFLVDADDAAEALAGGTGAQGRVEGEHIVGRFLEGDAVCFEAGGEIVGDVARQEEQTAGTVALVEGGLGGVSQSADVTLVVAHGGAVDDEVNLSAGCLHLLFQALAGGFEQRLVARFQEILDAHELAFLHDSGIALLHIHLQLLAEAPALHHVNGGEEAELGALRILPGAGEYVFCGVSLHLLSAYW